MLPRVLFVVSLVVCLLPLFARAESAASELDRWRPSGAVFSLISVQDTKSSVVSNLRPPDDLGRLVEQTQALIWPSIGGSLELLSPRLVEGFGAARVFVHGDLLGAVVSDRKLANEGAPAEFEVPTSPVFPEEAIAGQGSETRMDIGTLAWGAGIGVAFRFDVLGYEIVVKPSAEWYRYKGTFRGVVARAIKPAPEQPLERLVRLEMTDRRTWNAVGGGLELETLVLEKGEFTGHMFVTGRGYGLVGDRSINRTVQDETVPTDSADFAYKASSTFYNFGLGFRLRWRGL